MLIKKGAVENIDGPFYFYIKRENMIKRINNKSNLINKNTFSFSQGFN